jgi:hypothetical protein
MPHFPPLKFAMILIFYRVFGDGYIRVDNFFNHQ